MSDGDLSSVMNGVMWFQVVIAILFVAARIYTRHSIIHNIGWDDVFMLLNLITFILFVACISVGTSYGVGKKVALIPPANYPKAVMWEVIGQGICILGIAASKASVALFLLRIVVEKWHKVLLWCCIVITSVMCTVTTILLFVHCDPVAYLWDSVGHPGGICWNFTPVGIATGAWSAIMDFALAILPWTIIMSLNMKRKEKMTVLTGLSLGIFAGICSIIRTYELQTLSAVDEYVYDTSPMLLWSTTEILVTIICACVPVLRPLYVKLRGGRSKSESEHGAPGLPLHGRRVGSGDAFGARREVRGGVYMGSTGEGLQTKVRLGSEHASEESILREQRRPSRVYEGGGIVRTDEIVMTSSSV